MQLSSTIRSEYETRVKLEPFSLLIYRFIEACEEKEQRRSDNQYSLY